MYEKFGGLVNQNTRKVTFKLFLPDHEKAPFQYEGGGLPRITDVFVVGSFQDPATRQWDLAAPVRMIASDYRDGPSKPVKGVVYSHTTAPLPPRVLRVQVSGPFRGRGTTVRHGSVRAIWRRR